MKGGTGDVVEKFTNDWDVGRLVAVCSLVGGFEGSKVDGTLVKACCTVDNVVLNILDVAKRVGSKEDGLFVAP